MKRGYDKKIAFICEGTTEKEFYQALLIFLSKKYGTRFEKVALNEGEPDVFYEVRFESRLFLVKIRGCIGIGSMPHQSIWFDVECVGKYPRRADWEVFLCYDTDDYTADITQFFEGDWKDLRAKLGKVKSISDIAASADIEDVLLTDIEGICGYLGCPPVEVGCLHGRKGTSKMKELYKNNGRSYHKGERARPMIDQLDMQKIIDHGPVPLKAIEQLFM